MSTKLVIKESQELAIIKKQEQLVIAKSMVQRKPSLVKHIDCKKIKLYSDEEKIIGNSGLITYVLSLLGLSDVDGEKEEHYLAVDIYISEELEKYSYEEIKEAFKMYIKGTFSGSFDKVIYKLDCVILAKVMQCYDVEKIRLIRYYDEEVKRNLLKIQEEENQLSEEDKHKIVLEGLEDSFNQYKAGGGFSGTGKLYLYDLLFDNGMLPKDKKTKDAVMKYAVKNIEKKRKNAMNKTEKAQFEIFTSNEKYSNTVLNECRRISIIRFFDKFKTITQLLKKLEDNV